MHSFVNAAGGGKGRAPTGSALRDGYRTARSGTGPSDADLALDEDERAAV